MQLLKMIERQMNRVLYEQAIKPKRNKQELILLLLETIKFLYVSSTRSADYGIVQIKIDKMSRVFYQVENKIFSISFPFYMEVISENELKIYDSTTEVEINEKMVSNMIRIIQKQRDQNISIEDLYDDFCNDVIENSEYEEANNAWRILARLFGTETGYVRYDYDETHENGDFHPLNHLDINYSGSCTYKLGLKKEVKLSEFTDILDIKTTCRYIQ